MIKSADSLNFVKALRERQKDKRNKDLRPAWWTNALLPEVATTGGGLALTPSLIDNLNNPNIRSTDKSELNRLVDETGLKMKGTISDSPLVGNYAYSPYNTPFQRLMGLSDNDFGPHGGVFKSKNLKGEGWNLPALAHELGHGEAHFSGNPITKLLARIRPLGGLGMIGSGVESFRALSNKSIPIDDRKKMLDRASGIAGISATPTLVNEYQASRNGMRLLERVGTNPEVLEAAKNFYPKAFSTYALMTAAPVLAPQIAKLFLPKHVH